MKHVYLPTLGLAVTLLIACQSPSPVPPNRIVSDYCDLSFPILIAKSEIPILTPETKRQIYTHNEIWDRLCNNKNPPDKDSGIKPL